MSNGAFPPQPQRSSIFAGVLLILLGVLFLLHRYIPELGIGHLIARYWPLLLIIWGIAKLVDHLSAQRAGYARPPVLSGGEAALLVLLVIVLSWIWVVDYIHMKHPQLELDGIGLFSHRHSDTEVIPSQSIPAGAQVTVQTGYGDLTIHASDVNEIRVEVNKSGSASSESSARERMREVRVVIEHSGGGYLVHPVNQDRASGNVSVDLDVELPKNVSLTATSARGDITISGIGGAINATTQNGDVEIHDAGSDVHVQLQKGDVRVSDATGSVRISGKGSQIEISDVAGDALMEGDFFGPIRVRNVKKTTHYASQRSDITLLHLTGQLELDSGDIEISDVAGSAKIATHNQDMDIENVAGKLDISNSHGDIKVRYSDPPREDLNVVNESGEIDLTLPSNSSFQIVASSRSGDVQSDFEDASLKLANESDTGRLNGAIGSHGPHISLTTSYGTIYLRKSS
ncbi:MAG: DUF4097 family beta strand repeat-containing protein [Candidatus Acidiferrales bacterium]